LERPVKEVSHFREEAAAYNSIHANSSKDPSSALNLSVIIPVFNEASTVAIVLEKVCRLKNLKEVIVVDDGSTDNTPHIVNEFKVAKVRLVRQATNRGKTAAVKRALREVTGDITIFQDADLEYDPAEIENVIGPIIENKGDVVYGSRFLVKRATRVLYFYHYLANKALTLLSNIFTNVNMTDIETCYKAFRTPLIKSLPLTSSGFGMEVEITALISKTKARIYEVPISYYGRTYEEGKKIRFTDGLAALWYILYYNFSCFIHPSRRRYIREANAFLGELSSRSEEQVRGRVSTI
ncbi:MAG: glycosyltransferase family 2 protein, partial [Nitrososphaera sp.]|nr:glycosyltransferase family 2 protein [Nitrososphaera sp.]